MHPKLAARANADAPVGGRLRQERRRLAATSPYSLLEWLERRFQLHLIASCASICNRNRIVTGVRVTQRHYELAAEVWHMKEPQKLPLVLAPEEPKRVLTQAPSLKARWLRIRKKRKPDKPCE